MVRGVVDREDRVTNLPFQELEILRACELDIFCGGRVHGWGLERKDDGMMRVDVDAWFSVSIAEIPASFSSSFYEDYLHFLALLADKSNRRYENA